MHIPTSLPLPKTCWELTGFRELSSETPQKNCILKTALYKESGSHHLGLETNVGLRLLCLLGKLSGSAVVYAVDFYFNF